LFCALELAARAAFLPGTVRVVDHAAKEPMPIEADLPNGIRLRIPTSDRRGFPRPEKQLILYSGSFTK
jgi:hypothetical protein